MAAAYNTGSSTCLLAHSIAKSLHDVARGLNISLSVSWKRRCSDRLSRVADFLSKMEMEAAKQELGSEDLVLGYTSRTLATFMQNPRPERCLGLAILKELSSWMETLEVHVEWRDSYEYLVKLPAST